MKSGICVATMTPASLDIPLPAPEALAGPSIALHDAPPGHRRNIRHGGIRLGELRLTRSLLLRDG